MFKIIIFTFDIINMLHIHSTLSKKKTIFLTKFVNNYDVENIKKFKRFIVSRF